LSLNKLSEIVIDEISTDTVLSAGFDIKRAEQQITDFRRFIEQNKDELTALQILYAQSYALRHLTWQAVKDLRDVMARPRHRCASGEGHPARHAAQHRAPVRRRVEERLTMARYYPAIIEPASEGYGVFFPDVPGCTSAGVTVQEAARNAEEALQAHLDLAAERGEAIPPPSELDAIARDAAVVEAARVLVRAEVPGRSVRVNTTLPEELLAAVAAMRRGAAIRGRDYWRRRCGNGCSAIGKRREGQDLTRNRITDAEYARALARVRDAGEMLEQRGQAGPAGEWLRRSGCGWHRRSRGAPSNQAKNSTVIRCHMSSPPCVPSQPH
jgi:predicted RNase H-like HicB family nuclease